MNRISILRRILFCSFFFSKSLFAQSEENASTKLLEKAQAELQREELALSQAQKEIKQTITQKESELRTLEVELEQLNIDIATEEAAIVTANGSAPNELADSINKIQDNLRQLTTLLNLQDSSLLPKATEEKFLTSTQTTLTLEPVYNIAGTPIEAHVIRFGTKPVLSSLGYLTHSDKLRYPHILQNFNSTEASLFQASTKNISEKKLIPAIPLAFDDHIFAPKESTSNHFRKGGLFAWIISAVGLLGLILVGERLFFYFKKPVSPNWIADFIHSGPLALSESSKNTDLGQVLIQCLKARKQPKEEQEARTEAILLQQEPKLRRSMTLIGACAAVAPLLGLLGTVSGMIVTFQSMATYGASDPKYLSTGISLALVTTELGLIVAIPLVLAHGFFVRLEQKRALLLEEARNAVDAIPMERVLTFSVNMETETKANRLNVEPNSFKELPSA